MSRNRIEHNLQVACVKYFKLKYPTLSKLMFSVPNGGTRNKREAVSLKEEGLLAGVSDLVIAIPNKENHGLFIEFKTSKGVQSSSQREFMQSVRGQGYRYEVVRTFEQFVKVVNEQIEGR